MRVRSLSILFGVCAGRGEGGGGGEGRKVRGGQIAQSTKRWVDINEIQFDPKLDHEVLGLKFHLKSHLLGFTERNFLRLRFSEKFHGVSFFIFPPLFVNSV